MGEDARHSFGRIPNKTKVYLYKRPSDLKNKNLLWYIWCSTVILVQNYPVFLVSKIIFKDNVSVSRDLFHKICLTIEAWTSRVVQELANKKLSHKILHLYLTLYCIEADL